MQSNAWVFTINNYTDEDLKRLDYIKRNSAFWVWGKEEAPTTGTRHIQGYIEFNQRRRRGAVSKELPRAYLEPAKGGFIENILYCTKEGEWECLEPELGKAARLSREKEEDLKKFSVYEGMYICYWYLMNDTEEYTWEWWLEECKKRKAFGLELGWEKRYVN